ncbi:hypothetical protein SXANM310S_04571 [Streptomyces xanthochromogenes]
MTRTTGRALDALVTEGLVILGDCEVIRHAGREAAK